MRFTPRPHKSRGHAALLWGVWGDCATRHVWGQLVKSSRSWRAGSLARKIRPLHDAGFALFILADGPVDFLFVNSGVLKGGLQVRLVQGWVSLENLTIGHSQPAAIHQHPDRDTRTAHACIAALVVASLLGPTLYFRVPRNRSPGARATPVPGAAQRDYADAVPRLPAAGGPVDATEGGRPLPRRTPGRTQSPCRPGKDRDAVPGIQPRASEPPGPRGQSRREDRHARTAATRHSDCRCVPRRVQFVAIPGLAKYPCRRNARFARSAADLDRPPYIQ